MNQGKSAQSFRLFVRGGSEQLIFKESMMEKMDKWPMNEVANMAKRLNADLDQFIEDGYMDFKSLKYKKADQKNLLQRQVNNLYNLNPYLQASSSRIIKTM